MRILRRAENPIFLAILLCHVLGSDPILADESAMPGDFRIIAEYSPPIGFFNPDPWKSWKTTITGNGRVSQEIRDLKKRTHETKTSSLSKSDLRNLVGKVDEAKFFKLAKEHWSHVTHGEILILTITRNHESHRVLVFAPQVGTQDEEVLRFLNVWSEVLRKVPSPNPDQKPNDYLKKGKPGGEAEDRKPEGDRNGKRGRS